MSNSRFKFLAGTSARVATISERAQLENFATVLAENIRKLREVVVSLDKARPDFNTQALSDEEATVRDNVARIADSAFFYICVGLPQLEMLNEALMRYLA